MPTVVGHVLTGELTLCNPAKTTYGEGENICVIETIRNPTEGIVYYGILGVNKVSVATGTGVGFHTSWSGDDRYISPGCTGPVDTCGGPWPDSGVTIDSSGAYRLILAVCYSTVDTCLSGNGDWQEFSTDVTVTIINSLRLRKK